MFKKIMKHSLLIGTMIIQCTLHSKNQFFTHEELQALIHESEQDNLPNQAYHAEFRSVNKKKSWTIIVYMAADNDLHYFAWKNLKQLEEIGSNENMTIIVQLNTPGAQTPTKRYVVKKGHRILVSDENTPNQKLNSGSTQTLIDCFEWGVTHYPSDHVALFLWNHATGACEVQFSKTINPCDLFYKNPTDGTLELDRGISYLALMYQETLKSIHNEKRGICFDETFRSYLSNHDLEFALCEISTKLLNGKKIDVIGFDACLMAMIEITSICKKYAHYFVASQEVEYGTGWKYDDVLRPFLYQTLTPRDFAIQIVNAYEQAYYKIISDYTLSAIDLCYGDIFEEYINSISLSLHEALQTQTNRTVSDIIRKCKSTQYCTCFDEPTYIDIAHFLQNISQHIRHINLNNKIKELELKNSLHQQIQDLLQILPNMIIANKVGSKLKGAQGISICFPEHAIPRNYLLSPFAQCNKWSQFIQKYILS